MINNYKVNGVLGVNNNNNNNNNHNNNDNNGRGNSSISQCRFCCSSSSFSASASSSSSSSSSYYYYYYVVVVVAVVNSVCSEGFLYASHKACLYLTNCGLPFAVLYCFQLQTHADDNSLGADDFLKFLLKVSRR